MQKMWEEKGSEMKPLNEYAGDVLKEAESSLKWPYIISDGTALGFHREGDFIKTDTDIDIVMIAYDGIGKDVKEWLGWHCIREIHKEGKLSQLAFMHKDVLFDIYFYYREGDNYVNVDDDNRKTVIPKRLFDNPCFVETKYGSLPFPSSPQEYLVLRYGDDWMIPQNKKPTFQEYL